MKIHGEDSITHAEIVQYIYEMLEDSITHAEIVQHIYELLDDPSILHSEVAEKTKSWLMTHDPNHDELSKIDSLVDYLSQG